MKPVRQYLVRILQDKIYINKNWCMLDVRITNYVCTREILRTLERCWDAESNSSFLSALQTPQVNVLLAGYTIV